MHEPDRQPTPETTRSPPPAPPPPVSARSADDSASVDSAAEAAAIADGRGRDPWAHRRGEPRIFALLWTIFLFIATLSVFFVAMAGPSVAPELMRPAARLLLLTTVAGIVLLWPMVRLSQAPDTNPISGAFQDFVVVMIPAQALLWPQTLWWLARWPFSTVVALAMAIALWGLLIAGLLAFIDVGRQGAPSTARQPLRNAGWMLAFTGLAAGGLLVSLLRGDTAALEAVAPAGAGDRRPAPVNAPLMLSPLGVVLELTHDTAWTGTSTPLTSRHWQLIGLVGLAAGSVWIVAAGRSRRQPRRLRFSSST